MKNYVVLILTALLLSSTQMARAEYHSHRLGVGAGIAQINDHSHSYFMLAGEYEYRPGEYLGYGTSFNYIFSSPNFMLLAIPQAYFHPLKGDWYFNASPLLQFGGDYGTHLGLRIGTRLPISLGAISFIPQVNLDFINDSTNLLFGIGLAI